MKTNLIFRMLTLTILLIIGSYLVIAESRATDLNATKDGPSGLRSSGVEVKMFKEDYTNSSSEWTLYWRAEVWEDGQKVSGSDQLHYYWAYDEYNDYIKGQTVDPYPYYDVNYYKSHLDGNLIKSPYRTYHLKITVEYDGDEYFETFNIPAYFGYYEPEVSVNSPNGGETWYVGDNETITWSFTDYTGPVDIELSRNGGSSWEDITTTANDGTHSYEVTGSGESNNCLIRVIKMDISDVSNSTFSIIEKTITVTYPNGGEEWTCGQTKEITWTSNFSGVGNVKIELSTNNGSSWDDIIASTPNDGSYNYYVTMNESTNCLIRVSEADGDPSDVSNATFSILPPVPSVPQNLYLSGNYGDPPYLTWSASTWASSYKVYRRRSYDNPTSLSLIGTTENTYYTDNDIEITSKDNRDDCYQYRVKAANVTGESDYSDYEDTWGRELAKRGDDQEKNSHQDGLPEEFALNQNYPNPFNPVTTIYYQIPENAHVVIAVYNLQGQVVAKLIDAQQSAGYHQITWDASAQPSGIYVCRMEAADFADIQKLTLFK